MNNIFIIFRIALSKLEIPLTETKLKQKFTQADIDKDNLINFHEFRQSIKEDIYVGEEFEKFRKAFFKADQNNDGLITVDQFRLLLVSNY